jgi:hypothetical protein
MRKLELGVPYLTKAGKRVEGIQINYDYMLFDDQLCRYIESSGPRVIGRLIDSDHREFKEDLDPSQFELIQFSQLELF